jgi:adenylate cyclase
MNTLKATTESSSVNSTRNPSLTNSNSRNNSTFSRPFQGDRTLPAFLLFANARGDEETFYLSQDEVSIGRKDDNDLVLSCLLVSKYHARIIRTSAGYILKDLRSVNGMKVNNERVEGQHFLKDKDKIQLGNVALIFNDAINFAKESLASVFQPQLQINDRLERILEEQKPKSGLSSFVEGKGGIQIDKKTSSYVREVDEKHLSLVQFLPEGMINETTISEQTKSNVEHNVDFLPGSQITDNEVLKEDYEKLRLAYELSKLGIADINALLEKTLELMFGVLPVDRGVIMLVDCKNGSLTVDKVKIREGKGIEKENILLSKTVLRKVIETGSAYITSDAFQDPLLKNAESICRLSIRCVICVPLTCHGQVHGVLHLDSQDRINFFNEKDLNLVNAISTQAAIALENGKLIKDIEKEVTIREQLGRFLAPPVVENVIKNGEEHIKKGGIRTTGTILFADIRSFTEFSEKSTPEEVVELLNDFFERLVNIVFKYDGILDKYIGDCIMAQFGTLPDQMESEYKACCAALEFKEAVAEMNKERGIRGCEPISIGVGVNTGPLVAGFIGSSKRLEYTSIGDTVNTSSRICSLADKDQVLISESTLRFVAHRFETRFVDQKQFKGKTKEVRVFEIVSHKLST